MLGNGTNVTYFATTEISYSKNLWYEPIPFEMLRTFETKPQLMVTVDGLPAVCGELQCDFAYINATGNITSFTYDTGSRMLQISGVNLTNSTDGIQNVSFGLTNCSVDNSSVTNTSLSCVLD